MGKKEKKRNSNDRAAEQLAAAEKRLTRALRKLDDIRDVVAKRERRVARLMERHGSAAIRPESTVASNGQRVDGVDGPVPIKETTVPFLDQEQTITRDSSAVSDESPREI